MIEILWLACLFVGFSATTNYEFVSILWLAIQAVLTVVVIAKWIVKWQMWAEETDYATRRNGKGHL
jgi:hypothetical protein